MNTSDTAAEIRASDADRDTALSELSEHFQAGRLTAAEFDDRAGQALAARTWGELRTLLRDLPAAGPGPKAPAPRRPALLPAGVLAAAGIAVVMLVGGWGFWLLLLAVLFFARRVTGCASASRHPGATGL
jgi:Domain of unknown function (DUF1707)